MRPMTFLESLRLWRSERLIRRAEKNLRAAMKLAGLTFEDLEYAARRFSDAASAASVSIDKLAASVGRAGEVVGLGSEDGHGT